MLTLITGGARSGKSAFAQSLCAAGKRIVYVATATPSDGEMRERILQHRRARPAWWVTIEEPVAIAGVLKERSSEFDLVLIDCLTLWLSNLMFELREREPAELERKIREEAIQLVRQAQRGDVIAVTNEVGSGLVPQDIVGRRFRDLQGFVNQQIARAADTVYLLVSGIPVRIKPGNGVNQ